MRDFVAIDIETAQGKRWSICQIGLAIVEDGKITQSVTEYIKPPGNLYSPYNTRVHGITDSDTIDKPLFPEIWEIIYPMIKGKTLVAHNYSFDMNCLQQALAYYNMDVLDFDCLCTFKMTGKKLFDACADLGVPLDNHHNAESDAVACANIILKTNRNRSYFDGFIFHSSKEKIKKIKNNSDIKSLHVSSRQDLEFTNKSFCFTGNFAECTRPQVEKEVRARGGLSVKSVGPDLDYLVIGATPSPAWKHGNYGRKIEKAKNLIADNNKLKLVSEDDFIASLDKSDTTEGGDITKKIVLFRYKDLLKKGEFSKEDLTDFINQLKEGNSIHISFKYENPFVAQNLYGLYQNMDLSDSVFFSARIAVQFPLEVEVYDFIEYILTEFDKRNISGRDYTYSENSEGTATYARLFKEIYNK